jgi:hypothetical protein
MELNYELHRIFKGETYTIGKLYRNGQYLCDTIEDVERDEKIMHQTAIPKGIYKVIVNMSNRFKRKLPLLLDVPGFTGIRIHNGVDETSSSGCIIVGENKIKGKVINSRYWMDRITDDMLSAQRIGTKINIKIC